LSRFPTLERRLRVGSGRVRGRRAAAAVGGALATIALASCGTPSPDLFVVDRSGTVPGAKLNLLVSDQTARCNDGPAEPLTSDQILEARDILRELRLVQADGAAIPRYPPAQIFTFVVQTEDGRLTFPDTQQRPAVLPRLARFVRRVAKDTCGLAR
jgi:hypothetical protein